MALNFKFAEEDRRPALAAIAALGPDLVGVEVGVQAGHNAARILEQCRISNLYLVDPWAPYVQRDYHWDFSYMYPKVVERFKNDDRVTIIRDTSLNAVRGFQAESLDFVYIDAVHEELPVQEDVEAWYPKIRIGGIISGHDFSQPWPGVVASVLTCQRRYDWDLYTRTPDWWVVKDK